MKISIITVCYNSEKYIRTAIESVLSQTYTAIEYIIVDGGSKDDTVSIIQQYEPEFNGRMKWVSARDNGLYDAMNKGLDRITGDWVYFIGADDELYSTTVLSDIFEKKTIDNEVIYGNAYYLKRKKIRFGKMNRYHLSKHNFNHQTIFYPKSVFESFSYLTKYSIWADYYLNINLFFKAKYKFTHAKVIVSKFNDMGTSGINNVDMAFEEDRKEIISAIFPYDVYVFYMARRLFLFLQCNFKKLLNG